MNFFQRKNKTLVSLEELDWRSPKNLKQNLTAVLQSPTPEVRIEAKTIHPKIDLMVLEILLSFSSELQHKGCNLTWVFPSSIRENLYKFGLAKLFANIEFVEEANGGLQ